MGVKCERFAQHGLFTCTSVAGDPTKQKQFPGLVPLKVPIQPERGSDRDHSSDEDKHKLSPRDVSPGPRDVSPTIRDVSPSSARSPTVSNHVSVSIDCPHS